MRVINLLCYPSRIAISCPTVQLWCLTPELAILELLVPVKFGRTFNVLDTRAMGTDTLLIAISLTASGCTECPFLQLKTRG